MEVDKNRPTVRVGRLASRAAPAEDRGFHRRREAHRALGDSRAFDRAGRGDDDIDRGVEARRAGNRGIFGD